MTEPVHRGPPPVEAARGPKPPSRPKPGDRERGESAKRFQAFAVYRDLGPVRSLDKVGGLLGKSRALMERWSTEGDWVRRVRLWDEKVDRDQRIARANERIKSLEKARRQQDAFARVGLHALALPARVLLERLREDPQALAELREMKLPDLVKLVASTASAGKLLMEMHRLANGLPAGQPDEQEEPHRRVVKTIEWDMSKYPPPST